MSTNREELLNLLSADAERTSFSIWVNILIEELEKMVNRGNSSLAIIHHCDGLVRYIQEYGLKIDWSDKQREKLEKAMRFYQLISDSYRWRLDPTSVDIKDLEKRSEEFSYSKEQCELQKDADFKYADTLKYYTDSDGRIKINNIEV